MGVSIAVGHIVAICFTLIVVCRSPLAIAQDQSENPTDLVQRLTGELRTCPSDKRSDLLIEIGECGLGPDGKPLIPILLDMLGDVAPPRKQPSVNIFGPGRKLTVQQIGDREAEPILELIATFGREGVEPLRRALKSN
jgi:hypothetical protein